jgi:hypothetical protein
MSVIYDGHAFVEIVCGTKLKRLLLVSRRSSGWGFMLYESGIYNLGTGVARSFADLGRATFKALNIPEKFEWIDMPLEIRDQ